MISAIYPRHITVYEDPLIARYYVRFKSLQRVPPSLKAFRSIVVGAVGRGAEKKFFFQVMLILTSYYKYQRSIVRFFTSSTISTSDCYSALGVPFGASDEKIKEAYRKLAKANHPDLGGSTERFLRIQRAYEHLMDPSTRKHQADSSASSAGSTARSGSSYWRSWDTGTSWWNRNSSSYDSGEDFEAEFEEQWRRFNDRNRGKRGGRFKARQGRPSDQSETQDFEDRTKSRADNYKAEQEFRDQHTRVRGRRKHNRVADDSPSRISLSVVDRAKGNVSGLYIRVAKFNGRVCYNNPEKNLFVFWSNKNKDWKISHALKDNGDCIAFNSKVHPTTASPFIVGDFSKWMLWNERAKRYLPVKLQAELSQEDYSTWTVEKLREALNDLGLHDKVEKCFEKSELVDLMNMFADLKKPKRKPDSSANDPIPENHYRLCSRQRHDGVVQAPPVLSDTCKTGNNRVDGFMGPMHEIEDWLLKHGDRRRFYGVFDSAKNYCFGLIWKDNKRWARACPHEW